MNGSSAAPTIMPPMPLTTSSAKAKPVATLKCSGSPCGDAVAAVADDQLPRLELGDPADRLDVAGDQDQRAEQQHAEPAAGEGERGDAADRRHGLGHAEIAAVLEQRPEMLVFEPVLHGRARLERGGRTAVAAKFELRYAGSGTRLLDDLVGERAVELGQMVELGLVGRQALALRAQLGLEARQLGLRDQRVDPVPAGPAVARRPCRASVRAGRRPPR